MAATARTSSLDAIERIETMVGQIQKQFSEAAESMERQEPAATPIETRDIEKFVADQEKQRRERREALIERARSVVAAELRLRTDWPRMPDNAKVLLRGGWGPMMALRLIRRGADSPSWAEGMQLLNRILQSLDPERPATREPEAAEALIADLEDNMVEAGIPTSRISRMLRAFSSTLRSLPADQPAAPAAKPPSVQAKAVEPPQPRMERPAAQQPPNEILGELMLPGSWFHVMDRKQQRCRALRLIAYYPERDCYSFAEFNAKNYLNIGIKEFLEDLLNRKSAPIDAAPNCWMQLQAAIERYATQVQVPAAGSTTLH
jgi:hypothetical protein